MEKRYQRHDSRANFGFLTIVIKKEEGEKQNMKYGAKVVMRVPSSPGLLGGASGFCLFFFQVGITLSLGDAISLFHAKANVPSCVTYFLSRCAFCSGHTRSTRHWEGRPPSPSSSSPPEKLPSLTGANLNATHIEFAWPVFPRQDPVNSPSAFINPPFGRFPALLPSGKFPLFHGLVPSCLMHRVLVLKGKT